MYICKKDCSYEICCKLSMNFHIQNLKPVEAVERLLRTESKLVRMFVFLSLLVIIIASIGYFSDRLFTNESPGLLNSAIALEQNSSQTDSLLNQDSIQESDEASKNEPPATEKNHTNAAGSVSEDNSEIGSKANPSQLNAMLVADNTGKKHNLILFRYTTTDGSKSPSGANYPKKPSITLHDGDKLHLVSGNQDFKIVVYSMLLDYQNGGSNNNKNKEQPVYLEKKGSKFVIPDVSGGTYHLYIKTEYTPSDDDVAYFIDTVKVDKRISNSVEEEKQWQSNDNSKGNAENTVIENDSEKVETRTELNITVEMTSLNETVPSDTVFKVIFNNNQSQYGNSSTNFQSIPVSSQSSPYAQNIPLVATGINQSHSGNRIIKTIDTFSQPIPLQDNMTLKAVQLNETKPDDKILQFNASNLTIIQSPITLQFVPINQSVYRIQFISANQTMSDNSIRETIRHP